MRCAEPPELLTTADNEPPPLSPTMIPLAVASPVLKLRVEVAGVASGLVVTEAKPPAVAPATVRFPATAVALFGMPLRPATSNVCGSSELKIASTPVPSRLSRIRAGSSSTYRPPAVPDTKYPVTSRIRWVRAPAAALYTIDTLPVDESGATKLLGRVAPFGK